MTTIEELSRRAKRLWQDLEIRRRILLGQEKAREAKRLSSPSVLDRFWAKVEKALMVVGLGWGVSIIRVMVLST
jgi:hypothetical protein